MAKITAHRYHDISTGHRVVGHEHKCRHLHGHNYRIHFHCSAQRLDDVGRVIDFGVIKEKLCMWVENNWDHKFLHWNQDPMIAALTTGYADQRGDVAEHQNFIESLVPLPFNPTAENMAEYLVRVIGPIQLDGTGVVLDKVEIEETRKCAATYSL